MIDSHCHLAGTEFADDLDAVITRAREAGLCRCLVILAAEDEVEIQQAARVSQLWPDVRFAVGVHPHQSHKFAGTPDAAAALTAARLDLLPSGAAIGEIGLDYHYDFSPKDVQQAVFRAQLRLACERQLPVVIHTREADDDTIGIIDEEVNHRIGGVFHCFTGTSAAASRALQTGFHLSIPGIVTFPKATDLRAAVAMVPADRLLIETDSPYLAPIPFRGKRNEPAYVMKVLDAVATIRGVDRTVLVEQLVSSFDGLFGPAPDGS